MGNVFGTTSLTPPILDGFERFPVTNTVETLPQEPVDIDAVLDELKAFRAAEAERRKRYVESATEAVFSLFKRGQNEQAMAILRSLTRPEPFWATRFEPSDRGRS